MKKIILLLFLAILYTPQIASANVLYLDCYAQNNCDLCDAMYLMSKISRYILILAGSAAILFFVIGGVILLTSQGVSERIIRGRKMLATALIGIGIVYFAWAGVNFIIYSFADGGQSGKGVATVFSQPWNQMECVKMHDSQFIAEPEGEPIVPGSGCKSSWESGPEPGCGGVCVGFTISGIRTTQCNDASTALVNLFTCMDRELRDNPGRYSGLTKNQIIITSITDDNGLKQCRDSYISACFHARNSCHYGHGHSDGSYAADLRSYSLSGTQAVLLETLVRNCNGTWINETEIPGVPPHFHMSAKACGGK